MLWIRIMGLYYIIDFEMRILPLNLIKSKDYCIIYIYTHTYTYI